MTKLYYPQIALIALNAGFAVTDLELAVAICLAESGGETDVVTKSNIEYSVGLWQINLYAHPEVTETDMKNPQLNANYTYKLSKHGTDWSPWSAYTNGRYKQFLGVGSTRNPGAGTPTKNDVGDAVGDAVGKAVKQVLWPYTRKQTIDGSMIVAAVFLIATGLINIAKSPNVQQVLAVPKALKSGSDKIISTTQDVVSKAAVVAV